MDHQLWLGGYNGNITGRNGVKDILKNSYTLHLPCGYLVYICSPTFPHIDFKYFYLT